MRDWIAAEKLHLWHPFTPMRDWCTTDHDPLVLVSGEGALLRDSEGREYIDGNSSIWTNLHGHNHPTINAAIRTQLDLVAHTSFLGFTHRPGIELASALAGLWPAETLTRVFFSDDGSTAIEVALKMAAQYWQMLGETQRTQFVAFDNAYHGDTMGASSLGGVPLFHGRFRAWQFPVTHVAAFEELTRLSARDIAAVVIEPLIQGAAGMKLWPPGMLRQLREWCDANRVLLIADEVMTGFGRTGTMFACEREKVVPDFLAVAKGLTGGYLPLAATLTTERIFEAFLGTAGEDRTFYYGHSYTANQLGCAAALASLRVFIEERTLEVLPQKIALLANLLADLSKRSHFVNAIRQCGFIAGIELTARDGGSFERTLQTGSRVCLAARKHGLLTRPIRDVMVLMPPYCITDAELDRAVRAIELAISEVIS